MAELPHSYFSFNFCIPYVIPPRQEPACSAGISPPVLLRSHSSRLSVIILLLRLLPELRKVRSTSYRVVPPDLSCILMHPPELLCTPIIPRLSVVCIELVVYFRVCLILSWNRSCMWTLFWPLFCFTGFYFHCSRIFRYCSAMQLRLSSSIISRNAF